MASDLEKQMGQTGDSQLLGGDRSAWPLAFLMWPSFYTRVLSGQVHRSRLFLPTPT